MNYVPGVTPVGIAESDQAKATKPTVSVWVNASAGSGKTKVLTDRVLALLLADAKPDRILCLTFTKAAAAEMSNRIAGRLAAWVTLDDDALERQVRHLLGVDPLPEQIDRARQLFARVLDSGRGPQILTIHAFCQSVLRRFPLEAGVLPHFTVMDERDSAEALAAAQDATIARAGSGADKPLAEALALVTERIHELRFADLLKGMSAIRAKLIRAVQQHRGLDELIEATHSALGLAPEDTEESVVRGACAELVFDKARLERAVEALAHGNENDAKRGRLIRAWLRAEDRAGKFDGYCEIFLTNEDAPRKVLATKKAQEGYPDLAAVLLAEAERLAHVKMRIKAARVFASTAALLRLGAHLLDLYNADKARRGLMDFDDLIEHTRALLERPGSAAWVLYKLDGGIDHVLIDEAQDTNPEQWAIVTALTAEFFAGESAYAQQDEAPRTLFAVGDRKQSIYGFQGADPAEFARIERLMQARVLAAEEEWREIALNVSFRSTPAVLKAVDAVFSSPTAREGLGETEIAHLPARMGQAGLVELWPAVEPAPTDEPPSWKPPIERKEADSPQNRLAELIAKRIKLMIEREEILESQGRPIRPGDIMVLVRRRTGFVKELVRQLKLRDIAVAGVDRMVLTNQLAVMDLVALGQFLLLPEDDLTLATVLKGPLLGLDDDDLFTLAHDRGPRTLWDALAARAGEALRFGAAHTFLADLLAKTDYLGPAALYADILVARHGRRKILARLGADADDPIDEFMNLAYAYQASHAPSLQGFLHWLAATDTEIKRDLEQSAADAVRVITAHGAKGLQAPIVFLPDTCQVPKMQDDLLWTPGEAPVLLWAPSTAEQDPATRRLRDAAVASQEREYRRLLYVAMTRAEDRLYVCGWKTKQAGSAVTWYDMIRSGLTSIPHATENEPLLQGVTATTEVVRLSSSQDERPASTEAARPLTIPLALKDWAKTTPAAEPSPPSPLAPSTASRIEPAVFSPLKDLGVQRFQRGIIIHRLLQTLPELPHARRYAAAMAFVERFSETAEAHDDIVRETLAVLDDPRFAALFGEGSRAEVPLTGVFGKHVISAQVDRLAVTQNEVWIVDYKTNRPPPRDAAHVDPAYLFQMATYRAVIQHIYPLHSVRCALLWTAGPFIMELGPTALDAALLAH